MSEFENPVGGIAALDEEFRFAPSQRFGGNELPQEVLGCFDGVMRGNEFSGLRLRDDVEQDQSCLKFLRERYGVGRRSGRRRNEVGSVKNFADFPIGAA